MSYFEICEEKELLTTTAAYLVFVADKVFGFAPVQGNQWGSCVWFMSTKSIARYENCLDESSVWTVLRNLRVESAARSLCRTFVENPFLKTRRRVDSVSDFIAYAMESLKAGKTLDEKLRTEYLDQTVNEYLKAVPDGSESPSWSLPAVERRLLGSLKTRWQVDQEKERQRQEQIALAKQEIEKLRLKAEMEKEREEKLKLLQLQMAGIQPMTEDIERKMAEAARKMNEQLQAEMSKYLFKVPAPYVFLDPGPVPWGQSKPTEVKPEKKDEPSHALPTKRKIDL